MPPLIPKQSENSHLENFFPYNHIHDNLFTLEGRKEYEKNFIPPNFTIKQLRDAIPSHCFKKSLLKSSLYTLMDITISTLLFWSALQFRYLPNLVQVAAWPTYWLLQGTFGFGIWVIAHECGHQAFSDSKTINNAVGFVLHTFLLVPYHAWRISHAKHHAFTGHIDEDMAFVPVKHSAATPPVQAYDAWLEAWDTAPICLIWRMFLWITLGWPMYLVFNTVGKEYPKPASHFHPESPIFKKEQRWQIIGSNLGLIAMVGFLGWATYAYGTQAVVAYYGIPYLLVNAWLVIITFLHHTDVYLPHYSKREWTYVRGALTTVDRDFGWFFNWAMNHITDCHVVHHLFSQMPHYHAQEATEHLQRVLGPYYLKDQTNFLVTFYRNIKLCRYVDINEDVMFYKSLNWDSIRKTD